MEKHTTESCKQNRLAVQDTLDVVSGKWKLLILLSLTERPYRFKELAAELSISPRMLSKELQAMEADLLISRTVLNTRPITVEYAITEYGLTFSDVLNALRDWGVTHRKKIIRTIKGTH
ncbi:winged helix-turn-helix transcriptional regulator [Mucilaginibacter psychrotolerans]|uniref:Transcriptional regulator n=1 Tax=Mucilaginibacter psychrotolerans TaxID=1524096 RepID=A0A4Y8SAR5_9SPHI|nr:helix-turn-helix domain-containing protein [Mucilaginibacter psychrotolerans]TFF35486.1 transcriptional regulator [Mucilaginibacter psychrotolerans]